MEFIRKKWKNYECTSSESAPIWKNSEYYIQLVFELLEMWFKLIWYFRYSEEVFSQHSRRHSNNTNSDLSDDEIFLPDDNKSGGVRRSSKTGEILASPTHRKLTPTNIRSAGSSPSKRMGKLSQSDFRSLDSHKTSVDDLHIHYQTIIADLKQSHDESIKRLKYKVRALENPQTDEEYLVRTISFDLLIDYIQILMIHNSLFL